MPKYYWHLVVALFSFFALFILLNGMELELPLTTWIFSLLACLFGGLFPDIDSKNSKIHRIFVDFLVVAIAVIIIMYVKEWTTMLWLLLFWFLLSGFVFLPLKHRGFIHSVWTAAMFGFILGLISQIAIESFVPGFFAFLGYFSHLAIDRKV